MVKKEKKQEKNRSTLLSIWLIVTLLANAGTAIAYLFAAGFISAFLPTVPSWAISILEVLGLLNVVFTIFLFMWKKWAFFAVCVNAAIIFIINLAIGIGVIPAIFGLAGPLILYLAMRPQWGLFE